jgi:hypothetical protein
LFHYHDTLISPVSYNFSQCDSELFTPIYSHVVKKLRVFITVLRRKKTNHVSGAVIFGYCDCRKLGTM